MNKPDLIELLDSWGMDVPHNRSGWASVRCGFHEDRTKSASVHADAGHYYCFACGVRGDAWDLIMHRDGVSLREAMRRAPGDLGQPATGGGKVKRRYLPPGRRGRK